MNDQMDEATREGIGAALGRIPSGLFILTAQDEDRCAGMLASWVQQTSFEPPMVCVAVSKGRHILPIIRESKRFGLCQLPKDERLIMRKFASNHDPTEDPFLGFEMISKSTNGVPILANVLSYLECELACHIDVESDHDLLMGQVYGGNFLKGDPHVHLRKNGLSY